jgi:hypothetical protein
MDERAQPLFLRFTTDGRELEIRKDGTTYYRVPVIVR